MKSFEYKTVTVPDYKPGEDLLTPPAKAWPGNETAGMARSMGRDGWELVAIRVVPRAGPLASKGEREANHEFWFKREVQ